METLIRATDVERRTGLKKSKLYQLMAVGDFPKPIKLTERSVAWPESEVTDWIRAKITASRQGEAA